MTSVNIDTHMNNNTMSYEQFEMMYKKIHVPNTNGTYIQIKFDDEGVVYDIFDKDDEIIEECGYDFYHELGLEKIKIK